MSKTEKNIQGRFNYPADLKSMNTHGYKLLFLNVFNVSKTIRKCSVNHLKLDVNAGDSFYFNV